jgi:hypothetical protein
VTIGEHLQRQIRTCNRIKWGGVALVTVVASYHAYLEHSNVEAYAWMAAAVIPWIVALTAFGKRVRCPRCQMYLYKELQGPVPNALTVLGAAKRELGGVVTLPIEACPQCGTKFTEPYVGG